MIRFFTFARFHGKSEQVGSTFIRVNQVIKYWDEADLYKYGENPSTLIFQKVFVSPDYQFPAHFQGKKILDICDPMWLEGYDVVETCNTMDAVTCPTEPLAEFIRQFHDNVHVIPDRYDIEIVPEPKEHKGKAKTVVWFGYSHNIGSLKAAIPLIDELKLNLLIISNDDPIYNRFSKRPKEEWYTFKKYNEDTIYQDLQKADFAILPEGFRPEDYFKSNNRTIRANLAGLPVAKNSDDVKLYMEVQNRRKWFNENYVTIKEEYDCRKSVEQYKEIIDGISR
jgi:hypothetical protein